MDVEDVIELGSSDEESFVPPRKKMKTVENAMVHIPTKIHGVTIKPVRVPSTDTQKLFSGKNITVTKLPKPTVPGQASGARQMKIPNKDVQKPLRGANKKKPIKSNIAQKPMVINPLNHVKKMGVSNFVNCGLTKLQNPIPIATLPALNKLPPSVTVKKGGATVNAPLKIVNVARVAPKVRTATKRKAPVVQTVELDDEEPLQSPNRPQWYVRPEEPIKANTSCTQENINNKEPDKPKYIEITIDDSPIKPPPAKQMRGLNVVSYVVTIEDSPNKEGATKADPDDGSDDEPNTSKKVPHSKKKLEYEHKLQRNEERQTVEIEIDPIAVNEFTISDTEKENNIVTRTPNIVEMEESAVEIAENQEGDVSVVIVELEEDRNHQAAESDLQVKPAQSKEEAEPSTIDNPNDETEFSSTYLSFINLCLQLENSDDMKKIVEKKIKTYYRQVPKEYTQSEEFIDMVSGKVSAIKAAPEKMYLYIKDIVDELNLQRKLAKQMPVVGEKPNVKESEPETLSHPKDEDFDPSKQRQIHKLEMTLKRLNRAIHKLETQEVDFDDEEDSVYLLTEKYKEKMVRVHAKFCHLTNSKLPSEPRVVIDARPGLAPGPAKRLENWINRNDSLTFPDFHDVVRCVKEANAEDNLEWTDAIIMEEARDLFMRSGKKLQRRRQETEWRIATSRVNLANDPAEQSSELKNRLEDNRRLATNNENQVINMFSDRQNQLKLVAEHISDKEAEESPEESEEDDDDESLSLESKERRKERLKRLLQEQSKKKSRKPQLMETDSNDKLDSDTANERQTTYDDNSIQLVSDYDSSEIGSDVDELHLLQKLHSDRERRSDTSSYSSDSDSDTAIAISDTLDSSSDADDKEIQEKHDIISIENSSYSEDSDTQQSNGKTNERRFEIIDDIVEKSKVNECSPEIVAKDTCLGNDAVEDALVTSMATESSAAILLSSENTKSGKDTCFTNDVAENISLTSSRTESNASGLAPEQSNSGKDIESSEESTKETMTKTPKDLGITSKCSETASQTESNASGLTSVHPKSGKDIKLSEECMKETMKKTAEKDPSITLKRSETATQTKSNAAGLSIVHPNSGKDIDSSEEFMKEIMKKTPEEDPSITSKRSETATQTKSNASGLTFELANLGKVAESSQEYIKDKMKKTPEEDLSITSKCGSSQTESNASGSSFKHPNSGKYIESSEERIKKIMKKTPEQDLNITSNSNELCTVINNIGIPSNFEENKMDEGKDSNIILDKNTEFKIKPIKNTDPVPKSKIETLVTNSSIQDNSVSQSTFNQNTDPCKSDSNNKSHSDNPENEPMEEPTINSVPQAPTIDNSEISLTPLSVDSSINTTQDDRSMDSNDIIAPFSCKSLEDETCNESSPGVGIESDEPMEGVLEESEENQNPNQDLDDPMTDDSSSQITSNGNSNDGTSDLIPLYTKSDTADSHLLDNSVVTEKPMPEQEKDTKSETGDSDLLDNSVVTEKPMPEKEKDTKSETGDSDLLNNSVVSEKPMPEQDKDTKSDTADSDLLNNSVISEKPMPEQEKDTKSDMADSDLLNNSVISEKPMPEQEKDAKSDTADSDLLGNSMVSEKPMPEQEKDTESDMADSNVLDNGVVAEKPMPEQEKDTKSDMADSDLMGNSVVSEKPMLEQEKDTKSNTADSDLDNSVVSEKPMQEQEEDSIENKLKVLFE